MNENRDESAKTSPPRYPGVSVMVPLVLSIGFWFSLCLSPGGIGPATNSTPQRTEVKPHIRRGHDEEIVAEVRRAPKALVCLTSIWSSNAILSERTFETAIGDIETNHRWIGIQFFTLEESEPVVRAWLATLDADLAAVALAKRGTSHGNGARIWLSYGRVVAHDDDFIHTTPEMLVSQSLKLWGQATSP